MTPSARPARAVALGCLLAAGAVVGCGRPPAPPPAPPPTAAEPPPPEVEFDAATATKMYLQAGE